MSLRENRRSRIKVWKFDYFDFNRTVFSSFLVIVLDLEFQIISCKCVWKSVQGKMAMCRWVTAFWQRFSDKVRWCEHLDRTRGSEIKSLKTFNDEKSQGFGWKNYSSSKFQDLKFQSSRIKASEKVDESYFLNGRWDRDNIDSQSTYFFDYFYFEQFSTPVPVLFCLSDSGRSSFNMFYRLPGCNLREASYT